MTTRRAVLGAAGLLLAAPGLVRAQANNGVALVIGNSKYRWEAPLPNARRDASDIANAFQALGLKTELLQDANRDAMRAAVDRFAASARGADLAAFYFAGHGASWDKESYLVPEDADLNNPGSVKSLPTVADVGAAMKDARHRLLVFDSCRNNPADGWRQKAALVQAKIDDASRVADALNAPDTLTLFSTAPGRVALDGPSGENSPFAASFLRRLGAGSVELKELPTQLRRDVLLATRCRQLVWDHNTYTAPFQLGVPSGRPPLRGRPGTRQDALETLDLGKAYAYARAKKLPLPSGLLALRSSNGSIQDRMVGSFAYETKIGNSAAQTKEIVPALIVVMTAGDSTAEAIVATFAADDGFLRNFTARWRFAPVSVAGNTLEYTGVDGYVRYQLTWKDRDSGAFQQLPSSIGSSLPQSGRFTRLDG